MYMFLLKEVTDYCLPW